MKDYTLFDIADFVLDEDFIRWVNQPGKADILFWENWLQRNPNKHLMIAEARKIVESVGYKQNEIAPVIVDKEIARLLSAIKEPAENSHTPLRYQTIWAGWKYMAAAMLLVGALALASLFFNHSKKADIKFAYKDVTASRKLIENVNTSKNTSIVQLPDGSTVQLASDSRISYENHFDSMSTRDVYLSGQAFFTVKKDPNHPFRVFANEIVAKVLGTSFTVRAFEKDTVIQVTVNTGKVSVYTQDQSSSKELAAPGKLGGIIVTPNQRLLYEKGSQEFQKELLDNPVLIANIPGSKSMIYEDASLEKVFGDLTTDFGVNIVYDNELLKKCTVTANLSTESFYQRLDLICRAIGAKYEVIDAQVVIEASGCQ
ncbi:MAG: FecR domain-containing protein [Chitinophagaceae bacterium]